VKSHEVLLLLLLYTLLKLVHPITGGSIPLIALDGLFVTEMLIYDYTLLNLIKFGKLVNSVYLTLIHSLLGAGVETPVHL